ncbi:hypothetical protein BGZ60DRAFT_403446 [Tricladium varicosporioides]|nr:hypothetical protein BGZ60DRAFT_403446 [Hymenoscyphus varicosporioides]
MAQAFCRTACTSIARRSYPGTNIGRRSHLQLVNCPWNLLTQRHGSVESVEMFSMSGTDSCKCSSKMKVSMTWDQTSNIRWNYWVSPNGLPASVPRRSAAKDINAAGFVDLFMPNHRASVAVEITAWFESRCLIGIELPWRKTALSPLLWTFVDSSPIATDHHTPYIDLPKPDAQRCRPAAPVRARREHELSQLGLNSRLEISSFHESYRAKGGLHRIGHDSASKR